MQHSEARIHQPSTSWWHPGALALVVGLSGCAITPPPPPSTPAPAVQPLQQYMQEAGQAAAEGSKERARDVYRIAAKTYPTSKEPWLKLAEDFFETNNYGQAILASQEVLQRDPSDSVATSVLAVSGLRVSASALSLLRQQQRTLIGGTRTEAEDLAKVLRELLGEPILVPRTTPATKTTTAPAKRAPVARPAAGTASVPASDASVVPTVPKRAPPQNEPPTANPFDALKK